VAVGGSYFQLRHHTDDGSGNEMCLTVEQGMTLTISQCVNSDAQQYYFSWL